ncbi:SPOR domain-containing protein [Rhodocyclus purpureus]|uniref:SPOR domain-containing protein n=1 Tax=Rhodocyclus purpureus TaxID=1067 RepID=UPI0019128C9E|nr:SPOR domain-containing protein [Rhodocyclus purpureus]MBK5913394.1 hypothetical protein [Rhodocyclus purpureus]
MRALLIALVAANLLLFAWGQGWFARSGSADAVRLQQQVNADKLRIVPPAAATPAPEAASQPGEGEASASPRLPDSPAQPVQPPPPPAAPATAVTAHAPASPASAAAPARVAPAERAPAVAERQACLRWHDLGAADGDRLEALVAARFPELQRSRSVGGKKLWWVHIPPQASRSDAERRVGELRRQGVNELFINEVPGPNRFAISLGVFSSPAAAQKHLDSLRRQGVAQARVSERESAVLGGSFEVRGTQNRVTALRDAVARALPSIKPTVCGSRK